MWLWAQDKRDSPLDDDRLCCTGPAWQFSVKRKLEPDQVGKAPNRNPGDPPLLPFYCSCLFSPLRVSDLNMTVGRKCFWTMWILPQLYKMGYIHRSRQHLKKAYRSPATMWELYLFYGNYSLNTRPILRHILYQTCFFSSRGVLTPFTIQFKLRSTTDQKEEALWTVPKTNGFQWAMSSLFLYD